MNREKRITIALSIIILATGMMVGAQWQIEIMLAMSDWDRDFIMPFGYVVPVWLAHDIFYTMLDISFFMLAIACFYMGKLIENRNI